MESYDEQLHPDATYFYGQVMSDGKICKSAARINYDIVETDPYDGSSIVYERWLPLLQSVSEPSASSVVAILIDFLAENAQSR